MAELQTLIVGYDERALAGASQESVRQVGGFVIWQCDAELMRAKQQTGSRQDETPPDATPTENKKGQELKDELDNLLDEIDEVLEENAEEFVRSYVQKGGQ